MPLTTGQRLGPYEVVAPLGAGGMGEVYRARDTRLQRDVALKVLPEALARDPQRQKRLEREAQAISALSHPNVCALFDVGRAELVTGPVDFLVMELVEGETLADRLARGPLTPEQAAAVGAQVAEALGAAHARGIVHRDLKPGNVMLTRSGAKLLDFGLARSGDSGSFVESPRSGLTESMPLPLTREGTVVGTWPYLSPEQLAGRPADARSDVFALGAVLFEMLTGRRAFSGTTLAEVQAAILAEATPDPRAVAPGLPAGLTAVTRRCLEKDPKARWQSADDVAIALRLIAEADVDAAAAAAAKGGPGYWKPLALLAVAAAALLAGGLTVFRPRARPPLSEPLRFVVQMPLGLTMPRPTMGLFTAAAPDGQHLIFTASAGAERPSLWLWSGATGESRRLEGSEGGSSAFFSPDGREFAFFAGEELRRAPVAGGPSTLVTSAPSGHSGTWGLDGTILYTRWLGPGAGLWAVNAGGGEPRQLHAAARRGDLRAFPAFLPDGIHYIFLQGGMGGEVGKRRACVASTAGGEPECFGACDSAPSFSDTGHVVCVRRGELVALPFDAERRKVAGDAVALASGARWFGPPGTATFAVSRDGRLLAYEPPTSPSRLAWLDRNGRELGQLGEPARYGQLGLSRDGRRLVAEIMSQATGGRDLWVLDVATNVATRLTFDARDASSPVWSPDGTKVGFGYVSGEPPDVAVLTPEGGQVRTIMEAPGVQIPRHWSPDGRLIAYEDYMVSRRDHRQIWLVSMDGERRRFRDRPVSVHSPRFSPDSRLLAFVSEESGREEVYVAAVDGSGVPRRLSRNGGLRPRWRSDGREIFFFAPDGTLLALDAATADASPRPLFHVDGVTSWDFDYDVAPDGQRFLVRLSPEAEGSLGLRVVLNWASGLARAPAAGSGN
jgi:Tol biopolymer transport system component